MWRQRAQSKRDQSAELNKIVTFFPKSILEILPNHEDLTIPHDSKTTEGTNKLRMCVYYAYIHTIASKINYSILNHYSFYGTLI